MERAGLRRLFSACDVNKSGRIEFSDFTLVCRELNVPKTEVKTLFEKFDPTEDGYIDYSKFSSKFEDVSETLDLASFATEQTQKRCPWEEFIARPDTASFLSESLREQLSDLYQAILSSGNVVLLQQYEKTVHSLIRQNTDQRLECEQLHSTLKRAEEMNSKQLAELDEYIQQQLSRAEARVREEERVKMEGIMAALQTKHKNEVADLYAALERLVKSHEESKLSLSKEEVSKLNRQISSLSLENEQLQSSLFQAQTHISILHMELDKLKNIAADQKAQHQRETEELKRMVVEYQLYSEHIQILQKTNQRLYDSNDGLRSALAGEMVAAKRRRSPQNEIPARRMKPLRQSTLNHSGSATLDGSKQRFSDVATWADKYLDSGVSLPMDTAQSSVSDYDSDDSRDSYVPSDVEVSEIKSDAVQSIALSRSSSMRSSVRRRLSAFSAKPFEVSIAESEEPTPMYRLVLAGDAGSGKSSFLLRLTLNEFRDDIQTTLGVDFQMKKMLVDGERTSLQIWDTAGQERFRSIARSYFRKAHGVLLLYDVTSESSFLNVRAWIDQIQDSAEENIPMCVIGNKVDLREERPEGSTVSPSHGEKLAKTYNALFCETSAKEGTNVVEAVLHLAREVKKSARVRPEFESQVRINQNLPKKALGSCCGLRPEQSHM